MIWPSWGLGLRVGVRPLVPILVRLGHPQSRRSVALAFISVRRAIAVAKAFASAPRLPRRRRSLPRSRRTAGSVLHRAAESFAAAAIFFAAVVQLRLRASPSPPCLRRRAVFSQTCTAPPPFSNRRHQASPRLPRPSAVCCSVCTRVRALAAPQKPRPRSLAAAHLPRSRLELGISASPSHKPSPSPRVPPSPPPQYASPPSLNSGPCTASPQKPSPSPSSPRRSPCHSILELFVRALASPQKPSPSPSCHRRILSRSRPGLGVRTLRPRNSLALSFLRGGGGASLPSSVPVDSCALLPD